MFTGIVEDVAKVKEIVFEKENVHFEISCSFIDEVIIDQSIAHNGVCLTVVEIRKDSYIVTAIQETMNKTMLRHLKVGDEVNIERCLKLGDRLDGHMVQGHVDGVAKCIDVKDEEGSKVFTFNYKHEDFFTVEKGSITINGVSLTVFNSFHDQFSVAIIPYTLEHTNFKNLNKGDIVNLEFDIIGKYLVEIAKRQNSVN